MLKSGQSVQGRKMGKTGKNPNTQKKSRHGWRNDLSLYHQIHACTIKYFNIFFSARVCCFLLLEFHEYFHLHFQIGFGSSNTLMNRCVNCSRNKDGTPYTGPAPIFDESNFEYLKHVILKFMLSREAEVSLKFPYLNRRIYSALLQKTMGMTLTII